ncbi:MAG: GerMN domain-containing protein [Caldisericia bacterium]|jgi:spore germination protein GerM|nr:GerMN domain-containing protein [Caldisericia bacterium]HOW02487.1 GerMN domain-containing protein [Caldisericia bacterium]HQG81803.1 GerMN domain-containing protein [Caldisericia bacterium]HXK70418.1 GerMN domain-containing protein [Caldisericia bacterium]
MPKYDYVFTTERERTRKRRSNFIIIFLLLFLSFTIFLFLSHRQDITLSSIKLYFYDPKKLELIPIDTNIDFSGDFEKVVKMVIEKLSYAPENSNLRSLIPAYTRVKSVNLSQDLLTITFFPEVVSSEIDSVVKEGATVYSIVNSLTELPDVRRVKIQIEGNNSGFFNRYIDITKPINKLNGQLPKGKKILIYFLNPTYQFYVGEIREVIDTPDSSLQAESVINQLIIGSEFKELTSLIPQGTKLLSVKVENKIVYVNFSREIRRISLGAEGELDLVNLLTLSLTELPNIDRVRFLVEGEETYSIGGHLSLNEPIKRWYGLKNDNDCIIYFINKLEQKSLFVPTFRKVSKINDVNEVLNLLFNGVTPLEKDLELTTDIPLEAKLLNTQAKENNELLVNVSVEINKFLNALQEENFIRQIVLTVTENSSFKSVTIYFNGRNLESLPFGTDVSKSFTRNSF